MKIHQGYINYGVSRDQREAIHARNIKDEAIQLRIAENSESRLVLNNLALNPEITDKVAQELFNRDIPELTRRLENLGYEQSLFNKIF